MENLKSIWRDGSLYNIISCERQENKTFYWYKIVAKWSYLGAMPLFHTDIKVFYSNCERKVNI